MLSFEPCAGSIRIRNLSSSIFFVWRGLFFLLPSSGCGMRGCSDCLLRVSAGAGFKPPVGSPTTGSFFSSALAPAAVAACNRPYVYTYLRTWRQLKCGPLTAVSPGVTSQPRTPENCVCRWTDWMDARGTTLVSRYGWTARSEGGSRDIARWTLHARALFFFFCVLHVWRGKVCRYRLGEIND